MINNVEIALIFGFISGGIFTLFMYLVILIIPSKLKGLTINEYVKNKLGFDELQKQTKSLKEYKNVNIEGTFYGVGENNLPTTSSPGIPKSQNKKTLD